MEKYKIEIKTDGTCAGTQIYANGKIIGYITALNFDCGANEPIVTRYKRNENNKIEVDKNTCDLKIENVTLIQHINDCLSNKYKFKLLNCDEEVTFMTEVED